MKFEVQLERDHDSEMFGDLERYLKYHPRLTRFLFNPAGFTFLVGVVIYLGMLIGWLGIWFVNPEAGSKAAAVAGTQIFPGREAAIPLGIELGLPVILVALICVTQDLVTASWIYPLFYLYRQRNMDKDNFSGYLFAKIEAKAESHRPFIERYGAVGLFFFMLVPFAVNGPLIGAIVGKLAGIRTRYILPTLVLATATSIALWSIGYYYAKEQLERAVSFPHWIIIAAMLVVVGVIFLFTTWDFVRDHRRYRRVQAQRRALASRGRVDQTLVASDPPAAPPAAGGPQPPPGKQAP